MFVGCCFGVRYADAVWVPKTGIPSSGGDLVLVEEATQPVTPPNRAEVNDAGSVRHGTGRGALLKGAVRPMSVVVLDVDPQRTLEVEWAPMLGV